MTVRDGTMMTPSDGTANRGLETVSTAELARALGLHPQKIRKLVREGRIPSTRLDGPTSPLRFRADLVRKSLEIAQEMGFGRPLTSSAGGTPGAVERTATKRKPEPEMVERALTLVTTTELAQVLGVHCQTVYTLVRTGRIPAIRLGAQYRFDIDAVKAALSVQGGRRDV
jgi:excisionase family DNA binding protein